MFKLNVPFLMVKKWKLDPMWTFQLYLRFPHYYFSKHHLIKLTFQQLFLILLIFYKSSYYFNFFNFMYRKIYLQQQESIFYPFIANFQKCFHYTLLNFSIFLLIFVNCLMILIQYFLSFNWSLNFYLGLILYY